jgi:anti-anti-sigma factor
VTELTSRQATGEVDRVGRFTVRAWREGPLHVVGVSGDLDLASRAAALDACTSIDHRDVLVDLSELRFLDCAGYGAFVAATATLGCRGGSMVLCYPTGEPRRLLALIAELEHGLCAPLRHGTQYASYPATDSS